MILRALDIVFSPRDNGIEVDLIRLFHGEELDVLWYGERWVDLGLLLRFRAAIVTVWYKEWPDLINAEDIKRILRECAAALRTHAADILAGDFSIFPAFHARYPPENLGFRLGPPATCLARGSWRAEGPEGPRRDVSFSMGSIVTNWMNSSPASGAPRSGKRYLSRKRPDGRCSRRSRRTPGISTSGIVRNWMVPASSLISWR